MLKQLKMTSFRKARVLPLTLSTMVGKYEQKTHVYRTGNRRYDY